MKICILGANGQVGSEVTLLLSGIAGISLEPVCRSRAGSSFLRYNGIPVVHADVADATQARSVLGSADVVANFVLAPEDSRGAFGTNNKIIRHTFEYSAPGARIIFFSTLAVHGEYGSVGRRRLTGYSFLKRRNERCMRKLAVLHSGKPAYTLRLGHVTGRCQGFRTRIEEQVKLHSVPILNPARGSNVVDVATIADAIHKIGLGTVGPPGRYDLVNLPQSSWMDIYNAVSREIGVPVSFRAGAAPEGPWGLRSIGSLLVRNSWVAEQARRFRPYLSEGIAAKLESEYFLSRARSEIGLMDGRGSEVIPAQFWPEMIPRRLKGLAGTVEARKLYIIPTVEEERRWPADIRRVG